MLRQRSTVSGRGAAPRHVAAMVEFAIVAPIFFMIVFGVIEFGRGLMVQQLLTNAARNGARKAIVGGQTTSTIQTAVKTELKNLGLNTTNANVTVYVNDASSPGLTATTGSGYEVTVSVLIPVNDVSWLPTPTFLKNNLSSQFTMRME